MIHQHDTRTCRLCQKPVRGRSDKKFCDDYCRASYSNEMKGPANNFIRNVNHALSRNRRVLESVLGNGESTMKSTRDILIDRGFQFKYHTHQYKARNGHTYFYCYEYGYLPLERNWVLIVRKNSEQ